MITRVQLFLAVLVGLVILPTAQANGPWKVLFQNEKLPTQVMLEHYTWATPALAASTTVKSGGALTNGAVTTITSFDGQPDFPRNLAISFGGSVVGGVSAGTATVTGTNIFGKTISEDFSISLGQSTSATVGNKAFKSVTSVAIPAATHPGVTVFVGSGSKLGLPHCLADAGKYVFSEFNSVYDTVRGTAAVNATAVESNTFTTGGTMDGVKPVEEFYVQNFRCYGN